MLGLIYRELRLSKKTLATCLIVYLLFALLTDLYALSMQIGNLAKYCSPEELSQQSRLVPTAAIFGYLLLLVTAPEVIYQNMDGDFKTPWLKYALSSPKTIKEQIGAKYLAYLIMAVCAFVLGWLHLLIACALSGQGIPDGALLLFLASALIVMMVSSLFLPLAFYVQNIDFINSLLVIPVTLLTLGYMSSSLFFFKRHEDAEVMDYVQYVFGKLSYLSGSPSLKALKALSPFIALLVIAASFFLSVRILDKRRLVKGGNAKASTKKTATMISRGKGGKL